jgi:hypothetical protein
MKLAELIGPTKCRIIHYLSGDHHFDLFGKLNMSNSHFELLMACHHQGVCDDDCEEASKYFEIENYETAKKYLLDCGIEEESIGDDEAILKYYLWILSGDIQEMGEK